MEHGHHNGLSRPKEFHQFIASISNAHFKLKDNFTIKSIEANFHANSTYTTSLLIQAHLIMEDGRTLNYFFFNCFHIIIIGSLINKFISLLYLSLIRYNQWCLNDESISFLFSPNINFCKKIH